MLILRRKRNESIIIDDCIEITILEIDGDQIKLGIEAPKEIEIIRKEILEKVKLENQNAISVKVDLSVIE
ncbi:carbon storage regulator CsrA [Robertmurraya sp. Marseille-Q9965]